MLHSARKYTTARIRAAFSWFTYKHKILIELETRTTIINQNFHFHSIFPVELSNLSLTLTYFPYILPADSCDNLCKEPNLKVRYTIFFLAEFKSLNILCSRLESRALFVDGKGQTSTSFWFLSSTDLVLIKKMILTVITRALCPPYGENGGIKDLTVW